MTHTLHLDRSLRLAVSGETGGKLAAIQLTRSAAEVLADALLEFAGNHVRGLGRRTAVNVEVEALSLATKPRMEAEAQ